MAQHNQHLDHFSVLTERTSFRLQALAAFLLLLFLGTGGGGCADNGAAPVDPADTTKIIVPETGSVIHRRWVDLDAAGAELPGTEQMDTVTVTSSAASKFGRDSVVLFSKDVMLFSDALHYARNGDVAYISTYRLNGPGFKPHAPETWITMPFGSRTGGLVRSYDSSATVAGESARCHLRETTTYIDPDTLSVAGGRLGCIRVQIDRMLDLDTGPGNATRHTVATYWFAPSIGLVVRMHTRDSRSGSPTSYSQYNVMGYVLK